MPLRDHFHPPLHPRRHWHSFHHAWATCIAFDLNRQLPAGYFAEPNVQFGIEIDVATYEEAGASRPAEAGWQPPGPALTAPISLVTDVVEVAIFQEEGGYTLAGAIELASPSNKDRPASLAAFVSKCAAYVQQGIGLAMVDIVTERSGNLHDELLARLEVPNAPLGAPLYATAYRPLQRDSQTLLEVWQHTLAIGQPLPTLPLYLRGGMCLRVPLEDVYELTFRELKITSNGA